MSLFTDLPRSGNNKTYLSSIGSDTERPVGEALDLPARSPASRSLAEGSRFGEGRAASSKGTLWWRPNPFLHLIVERGRFPIQSIHARFLKVRELAPLCRWPLQNLLCPQKDKNWGWASKEHQWLLIKIKHVSSKWRVVEEVNEISLCQFSKMIRWVEITSTYNSTVWDNPEGQRLRMEMCMIKCRFILGYHSDLFSLWIIWIYCNTSRLIIDKVYKLCIINYEQ